MKMILLVLVSSTLLLSTAGMAESWKKDTNPNAHLDGTTVGYTMRFKSKIDTCKAFVEDGAGLGLKDGKVLVDNNMWYGQSYEEGTIKLGCMKIHSKLTQLNLTLPTGHELEKKLELK